MAEAATGVIKLPGESPEVFKVYAEWLYGGSLPTNQTVPDLRPQKVPHFLVEPYLMGERLMDDVFLDHTEAAILESYKLESAARRWSDWSTIDCIYRNAPPGSKPRHMAIARGIAWYSKDVNALRERMNATISAGRFPERLEWVKDVLFAIAGAGHDPVQLAFALAEKVEQPKNRPSMKMALGQIRIQIEQLRQSEMAGKRKIAPEGEEENCSGKRTRTDGAE